MQLEMGNILLSTDTDLKTQADFSSSSTTGEAPLPKALRDFMETLYPSPGDECGLAHLFLELK